LLLGSAQEQGRQRQEGLLVDVEPEPALVGQVLACPNRQTVVSYGQLHRLNDALVCAPQARLTARQMLTNGVASALGVRCTH